MEERISEFIADYIPKRITKETRYKLQAELENHIYERIDYYTEIGYSEEESLEKALKDFGDDEETKEQIKKEMGELHRPFTLADLFSISIPITVAIIFFGSGLLNYLLKEHGIKNLVVIPLLIWLVIIALKRAKRIHHIVKSVIAFILIVPYFLFMLTGYFFWSTNFYTNFNKSEVIEDYYAFMIDEETNEKYETLLPHPDEIGNPVDANSFDLIENSAFTDPSYYTWIFKYTPEEYEELKEKFNKDFEYMKTYSDYDLEKDINITRQCSFTVYDFHFKTINVPEYEFGNETTDNFDYWALIGTNDETCEIAFIYLYPEGFTPSFDDEFIKEDCGWKYYYIRKRFHNL